MLSSLPVSIVAFMAYQDQRNIIIENIGEELENSAYNTMLTIDRLLHESQKNVQEWASTDVMQQLNAGDTTENLNQTLITWKTDTVVFEVIAALTPEGKVVASSNPTYTGQDISEEPWFQSLAGNPRVYVGGFSRDKIFGDYSVNVGAPVFSATDNTNVIGFVTARLSLNELLSVINFVRQENKFTSPGSVRKFLINKEGRLLLGPDSMMGKNRRAVLQASLPDLGFESARWALYGQRGRRLETDNKGEEFLIGYAGSEGYRDFTGLGWAVLVMEKAEIAFAPLFALRDRFLMSGTIVGIIVILLAIFIARRISIPIQQLTGLAKKVASGDLSQTISLRSQDEIGELGTAFNHMTADLKRSTQELLATRDYTNNIISSMVDSLIVFDSNGIITEVNQSTVQLLGYEETEILGQPITVVIAALEGSPGSRIETLFDELSSITHHVDQVYLTKDGREIPVSFSGSTMRDESGKIQGVVCVAKDITTRKRAEAQLLRAKEQAEEAVRMKAQFLAMMSHEIRTPMNGIVGMTELLVESGLTNDQRMYAETVRNSSEALLTIINDILDFSKIEAGKLDMEVIDLDLQAAVEDTVDLLAERAAAKGLDFVGFVEPNVPTALRGDPVRLRQILLNLASNAIKFTEEGEVTIRVTLEIESNEEVVVRFQVRDTGVGVSKEGQSRLFKSFSQADSTTTRQYGGTGLGLAISKLLTELMHGEIGVNSTPGQGSTFWFTARLAKQPFAAHTVSASRPNLGGLRICCAVNNPTIRQMLTQYISGWGMNGAATTSSTETITELQWGLSRGEPYDVAILDMDLPDMDGLNLARTIKNDPALTDVRLVLLISIRQLENFNVVQDAGFAAYVNKPIRKVLLETCLQKIMGRDSVSEEPANNSPLDNTLIPEEAHEPTCSRILLVDDHGVNQQLAGLMLERLGHRVEIANNGQEAIEAVFNDSYDLVFMDCQMPIMDGYEATQAIRKKEECITDVERKKRIPIIAMTANAMQGDKEKCLDAGMDDYVSKPIKRDELAEVLAKWLPVTIQEVTTR